MPELQSSSIKDKNGLFGKTCDTSLRQNKLHAGVGLKWARNKRCPKNRTGKYFSSLKCKFKFIIYWIFIVIRSQQTGKLEFEKPRRSKLED